MRINALKLRWFRGATTESTLQLSGKSRVIYGQNGAGKSSFVDAIEYLVRGGRVDHLSHEYSGAKQEKGILNTSLPAETSASLDLVLETGSVHANISPTGLSTFSSEPPNLYPIVQAWQPHLLLLRQDRVSEFIHSTKSEKFSALLPLLGLDSLEQTVQNLRQLIDKLQSRSNLSGKNARVQTLELEIIAVFTSANDAQIRPHIEEIAARYAIDIASVATPEAGHRIVAALDVRIKAAEPEQRIHMLIQQIESEALNERLDALIAAEANMSEKLSPLLDRHVAVLEKARLFAAEMPAKGDAPCPACGRAIPLDGFRSHVNSELVLAQEAIAIRQRLRVARQQFASAVRNLRKYAADLGAWLALDAQKDLRSAIESLPDLAADDYDGHWSETQLDSIRQNVPVIAALITATAKIVPPSIQQVVDDRKRASTAEKIAELQELVSTIAPIEKLTSSLNATVTSLRQTIKTRTEAVIGTISTEAQTLWSKLHPGEPIENIHLHIPHDADKAIDVALTFYGRDQPSPRLTLSEGHRNSLGLCIFLALAKLRAADDQPIFLDDVVSSLDRGHRGMLADVLVSDLAGRQLVIFTHDREWFTELKFRLPRPEWDFLVLRPSASPDVGIQWAQSSNTFADARALVETNPNQAANAARAVMDESLSLAAERLKLTVTHLRGDKNDQRLASDFMNRFISECERLKRKHGEDWISHKEAIDDWRSTWTLLLAWANRGSHAGTVTPNEANALIDSCERALSHFRCPGCASWIWLADQSAQERLRCDCGNIRWKYG